MKPLNNFRWGFKLAFDRTSHINKKVALKMKIFIASKLITQNMIA